MGVAPWILPVAWMGVIFWLSTAGFSAEATGRWILPLLKALLPWAAQTQVEFLHGLARKGGHVTEYAILAWLWYRSFVRVGPPALPRGRRVLAAFGLTVAYASLDELHQAWTGRRGGSAADVVLDAMGGGVGLLLTSGGWRGAAERLTTALLWIAALGGSLVLLVGLLAGVPARWLWASVPLAWLTLWAWRRQRRLDRSSPW